MLESIVRGALRFKALLAALAAGLLVVGAVSLRSMPSDVTPELAQAPVLEVQTEALGLSAPEVEQYVTDPMEQNLLAGVLGVWNIRSESINGLSEIHLYFEPGTDIYNDRLLVEERLTNAFSLPNISQPPVLIQPTSTNSNVLMIGLRSVSKSVDPLYLSYLARWVVKPKLSGVPGVADVAIFGQRDQQIQVLVDPRRLAANHVTLSDVISTTGNAQLVSPLTFLNGSSPGTGGFLDGPNQRLDIRPVLPLSNPRNVAAVPVKGKSLGRIARVVLGNQPLIGDAVLTNSRGQAVSNGDALVLEVEKLPGASTLGVTNGIERALRELNLPSAIKVDTSFFRPASYVQEGLSNLALGLLIGAALALLVLGALLLQLRAVVIAAVSVAVSMVAGVLLLQLFGYTFNAIVALGLMVASAVVVDDAV
ncbi:MAG TPA: efflux RND transporter permease subunit, partial [Solirubrobacteraceae bacterium]|nr:efflux RND transporter permease subunit [Solirubrobacteraceae bacterium]